MAVERSKNGVDFVELGRVKGAGTTYIPQSYQFVDRSPLNGVNYYRLRQVDFDGTTTYHKTIAVENRTDQGGIKIFPTEVKDQVNISFANPLEKDAQMNILDMNGRLIQSQRLQENTSQELLNVSHFAPGMYFIQMEMNGQLEVARFSKK